MPLEAGSVFVRIAGLFDKSQFDMADKRVDAMRANAKDPIVFNIGVNDSGVPREVADAREMATVGAEKPVDIPVGLDTKALPAEVAAAREEIRRGIGSPNASDPFKLSFANEDRQLLKDFLAAAKPQRAGGGEGVASVASDAVRRAGGRSGGSLSIGGLLAGLLHKPGGPFGLGGFSLGSMIGLGPEHLLTALGSMAGTLVPAAGGGALLAGAAAGKEVVGGGADALIQHTTRANTEAIYQLQQQHRQTLQQLTDQRNAVIQTYGAQSRQATAARQQYRVGVSAANQQLQQGITQQAGTGAGATAETQLATNVKALSNAYKAASQTAQAESAKFYEQIVNFAKRILPFVIQSATRNLAILDKDIKPLFAWLGGPQGMGIFKDLENHFAKQMPTSIHAATQAIELVLKLIDDAAKKSGGLSKSIDHFFTRENSRSAESLQKTVNKLVGDFHDWANLAKAVARVVIGLMHDSAHEGIGLVKQLTDVLDKMAKWERSAAGSKELHSFFVGRSNELQAILKTLGPLLKVFFQFYMSVQALVPGVTKFFEILTAILGPISKLAGHSKLFRDAFVLPLGAFILLWNRFGFEKAVGVVRRLGSAFGFLGKHIGGASKAQGALHSGLGKLSSLVSKIPFVGGRLAKHIGGSGVVGDAERAVESEVGAGGGMHIGGATGMGTPGTKTNPVVVTVIDPKFSGMGSQAKDYVAEEEGAAKTVEGEAGGFVKTESGLLVPGGAAVGAAEKGVATTAEEVASGGLLAKLGSLGGEGGLLSKLGGLKSLAGGVGAIGASFAAPMIGHLIGGSAGRAVSTIGGDAATGAGFGMMFGPEGAAVGGALGAGYGIIKNAGGVGGVLSKDSSFYGGIAKSIGHAFSSVADSIGGWFSKAFDNVVKFAKKLPGDFVKIGGDVVKFFESEFQKLPGGVKKIIETVIGFLESLPGKALSVAKDVVGFIESHIGELPGDFVKIGKSILSTVESLPGDFLKLGENIVKSIVHGIESAPSAVLHAIEGIIPKPIRNILSGAGHALSSAAGSVAHFFGFAGGGQVPGSEFGLTDRMTLVDPSGRPRARMAGDESFYTRHQRPYVDAGLRMLGFGGSEDLWNKVKTPHSSSGGGWPLSGDGRIRLFATGGGPASDRTINAMLSKYGTAALNAVDTKVSNLDNKYTTQDNIYTMYNPQGLSTKQLGVLMGIREQQWDLLYNEWLKLPAALKALRNVAYGPQGAHGDRTGGTRTTVRDLSRDITALDNLVTSIGGDAKPGTTTYQQLKQYYKGQSVTSVTSYQRTNAAIRQANAQKRAQAAATQSRYSSQLTGQTNQAINSIPGAPSNGTMNQAYKNNAQQMSDITTKLTNIHTRSLQITRQINQLLGQRSSASNTKRRDINNQIASLREQRTTNNADAVKLTSQLSDLHLANQGIGVNYQDQAYYARFAKAAAETGLTGKTTQLQLTLRQLRAELANEQKLEQREVSAISTIKGKLGGSGSGNSVVDELSNYGQDMMQLNQQGAKVPVKYVNEIDKVFKALGIKLPHDWQSAAATAQATASNASFQAFQQSLISTFGQYGSNFVNAGANPYGNKTAQMAGNTFYGAAQPTKPGEPPHGHSAGTLHLPPGGGLPSMTPEMQGGGDTHINITQHFGGPAPSPHSYSHGLRFELENAMG